MKTAIKIFALLMLTASFSSCGLIEGWSEVDLDSTLEAELDIQTDGTELKSTDAYKFNKSTTLNVLNSDLEDYSDLIKDINAQKVTIEVISVDSLGYPIKGVTIMADTEFGISNPSANFTWTLESDWPIEPGFEIELPAESYSVLNTILNEYDLYPVTVSADGTCNKGNMNIVLNYGIEVKVIADPL